MTDKIMTEGTFDDASVPPESAAPKIRRVDPVSLVAGLLFIAIALAALTDRYWADLDGVLVVGGAIIAIGVAMMAGVIARGRRGGQGDG